MKEKHKIRLVRNFHVSKNSYQLKFKRLRWKKSSSVFLEFSTHPSRCDIWCAMAVTKIYAHTFKLKLLNTQYVFILKQLSFLKVHYINMCWLLENKHKNSVFVLQNNKKTGLLCFFLIFQQLLFLLCQPLCIQQKMA